MEIRDKSYVFHNCWLHLRKLYKKNHRPNKIGAQVSVEKKQGYVGVENPFTVETSNAGMAGLNVQIAGPVEAKVQFYTIFCSLSAL